jgi:hypothetical protein
LIDLADGNRQQRTVESADLDRHEAEEHVYRLEVLGIDEAWNFAGSIREARRAAPAKAMKTHQAAASLDHHPCLRRACSNQGKLRSQARERVTRTLFLCDDCFGSLPAHKLRDLFLQNSGEASEFKAKRDSRAEVTRDTGDRYFRK